MASNAGTIQRVHDYVRLAREVEQLGKLHKTKKSQLESFEAVLADELETEQVKRLSVDGCTVYLSKKFSHRLLAPKPDVIAALRVCDLADLVKEDYSWQSLNASLREKDESGEGMPPALVGLIEAKKFPSLPILGLNKE